jgi:DNA (cytosine-5)-methyltransferase 1
VGENVRGLTNWNGGLVFDEVQSDLEAEGYEVTPFLLPACGVNAPHKRDRIWFIAYSKSCADSRNSRGISNETKKKDGKWIESSTTSEQQIQLPIKSGSIFGNAANCNGKRLERGTNNGDPNCIRAKRNKQFNGQIPSTWQNFPTVSALYYGDDGISDRLDGITFSKWRQESIKAGGNAVVPQVVYQIFKAIEQYNKLDKQLSI